MKYGVVEGAKANNVVIVSGDIGFKKGHSNSKGKQFLLSIFL